MTKVSVARAGRSLMLRGGVVAAALLVSACGGGSDDGTVVVPGTPTATPSPTPTTPPATAQELEYRRSNAAVAANADAAYRAGATGRGIRIAILDTGVTAGLPEFMGRIDPASADIEGGRGIVDTNGHGTAIASVALAARDGRGMHGVAFDATLVSLNVSRAEDCTREQCPVNSASVIRAIDAAIAAGARVINMSFGGDQTDDAFLAAVRRAAAAGIVIVASAGNQSGGAEPRVLARSIAEAGGGHVILVGGHDGAGRFYAGGNQAGTGLAAASYLTALAVEVNVTSPDGTVAAVNGNSVSTAAVSGAVALIAQARPNLTGAQIVSLLLGSATDAGAPGRDPVYGNGMLNVAATFAALGMGG